MNKKYVIMITLYFLPLLAHMGFQFDVIEDHMFVNFIQSIKYTRDLCQVKIFHWVRSSGVHDVTVQNVSGTM